MKTFLLLTVLFCFCANVDAQVFPPPPPPPTLTEDSPMFNKEDQTFSYVEQMPEFIGGTSEMYKFISANIYVPDSCAAIGVAGTIAVQFTVDSMGYIKNPKVVRSPSIDCGYNEVVLQMLQKMNYPEPHWIAGRHNGKNVNVAFTLPVKFRLSE